MRGLRSCAVVLVLCVVVFAGMAQQGAAEPRVMAETSLAEASLTFWGEDIGDWSGYSVSPAGDVNNDGYSDILIGAPYAGLGGPKGPGKAYLVLGRPRSEWPDDHIDLQANETSFVGPATRSMTGRQNYTAGDVNGDGFDDFLVTTWKYHDQRGKTYLYLGRPDATWGQDWAVGQADASFTGEDSLDRSGWFATTAGDVNGDGYDDFIIAAVGDEEGGGYRAGQVYLILGRAAANWGRDMDLGLADASFLGEAEGDVAGRSVAPAGDVNDDGYDDFLIGAIYSDDGGVDAGQGYLILGRQAADWGMDYSLAGADASFIGEVAGDEIGRRVMGAGDVNSDGFDDLLFGASYNDQSAVDAGKAYLVLGRDAADWGMDYSLSLAEASFLGEGAGDQAGRRVSNAGDVNDDGYDDFLIGAPDNDRGGVGGGAAYLFYGRPAADWGTDLPLDQADVVYVAESDEDNAGFDIAPAGDMDGDGIDDFLVGAWNGDEHGGQCGQTYVMLSDGSPAPTKFNPSAPEGRVGEWHGFTGEYWDPDGWEDMATVQIVLGKDSQDRRGFNSKYVAAEDAFYLRDAAGLDWIGPCAAGEPTKLSNGIVQLDCTRSGAANRGDTELRVVWRSRFIRKTVNPRELGAYLRAIDQSGNDSGFLELGTWTLLPEAQ